MFVTDGHGEQEYHNDWMEEASCASIGPHLFFSDAPPSDKTGAHNEGGASRTRVAQAREVCEACPVWRQCRYVGLGETDGVWAGTITAERRRARAAFGFQEHPSEHEWNYEERLVTLMRGQLNQTQGDVDEALIRYHRDIADQPFFHRFGYREPVPQRGDKRGVA